ncbi:MAG: transglutaminase-like domain-containing protein [Pseudomonadota bacterium]
MKMSGWVVTMILLLVPVVAPAANYEVSGGMNSGIRYTLQQQITGAAGLKNLELRFVMPETYNSPTYGMDASDIRLVFTPPPAKETRETDQRGNIVVSAVWEQPPDRAEARLTFTAATRTQLDRLNTSAPFPVTSVPPRLTDYVSPTAQVQSDHPDIRRMAVQLTAGAKSQFDAVQRILSWVVDNLKYVNPPEHYDALYAFTSGKGNCQNFSHLAAALMRVVGIPARIVNGITLNRPFDISRDTGPLTFKMAQGRHSWIEVWFPDLDWVPFDPQQTELFIPNRYIRLEVGVDNKETINDGLLRWSRYGSTAARPQLQESISADFTSDRVTITGRRQEYGPRNLLLCPQVSSPFEAIAASLQPEPIPIAMARLKQLDFKKPFLFGNLSFPVDVDFAFPRSGEAISGADQLTRNFLVESAEYVTTKATQYAQATILEKPVKLEEIALALHNFGGAGMLWVELRTDAGGMPGEVFAASDLLDLGTISTRPGYRWETFDFRRESPLLSPGTYWIVLGFTGSPIVNWFYTYGKPVGPAEGTRYKDVFEEKWSGALSYEFNYRVQGTTAAQ